MTYTYDELLALITQRGVHAEFGDAGEGYAIEQNPHELAVFLVRMQELGVQSVLEIGTGYKGGLSRFLAHDMGWDVTTYDIQNYGHVFEGVHYIVGKQPTLERQFDLVFIDGNHSYESVKQDHIYWGERATKVIAFHDIEGLRDCQGVANYWREIATYPSDIYFKSGEGDKQVIFLTLGYSQVIDAFDNDGKHACGIGWIEDLEL